MTLEEIEEMKKREARKDRLHQNYLKRKANGKQQEYYERTKAKKESGDGRKKKRESVRKILQKVCSFQYHCFHLQNQRKELHQHEQIRKNHS